MEAKKSSSKQVVAIMLLVIGLAAGVFGVLGLVGGGGTDPYEALKSVVMVYSYLQLTDGQSAGAMGTGFAIGKPGEPVEYIVTNGHVVEYDLQPGQSLLIDTGLLAAMTDTVQLTVEAVKGVKNMVLGGEGLFNTRVTGPGHIWLQTMPFSRLAGMLAVGKR